MAAKLKVFVTSDGLTDYIVAASSRPKALAAWGSHQDLFKTGSAHETDDAALVKAAQAQPGEVLKRPAGARGALSKLKASKPAAPEGPSKAQLRKVADLEARLAAADDVQATALAAIDRKRADLDRQAEALAAKHAAARSKLEAALSAAKQALG